jgi:hypothetical protein
MPSTQAGLKLILLALEVVVEVYAEKTNIACKNDV